MWNIFRRLTMKYMFIHANVGLVEAATSVVKILIPMLLETEDHSPSLKAIILPSS